MSILNRLLNEYREGYTYLFHDKTFYKKLWLIPLLLFFPFLKYPFGILFIKGWQVKMVEDIMFDKDLQPLDIKTIFLKGIQITGVTILYLFIPTLLCYILGLKGILSIILDIVELVKNGLWGYIQDYIEDSISTFLIYILWGFISNPILQCGIIRYAITGKWVELLNIPKNLMLLIVNIHKFIKFYVFYLVTLLVLTVIDLFLFTIFLPIEIILHPFLLVLYYGSVSHELGHLARDIYIKEKQKTGNILVETAKIPDFTKQ